MLSETYVTKSQAAKLLGVNPLTIYRWIKAGRLKAERLGREVLIRRDELALVERSSHGPAGE